MRIYRIRPNLLENRNWAKVDCLLRLTTTWHLLITLIFYGNWIVSICYRTTIHEHDDSIILQVSRGMDLWHLLPSRH